MKSVNGKGCSSTADSFVYRIPLSLEGFLLGKKWENVVEMYISSSRAENIFSALTHGRHNNENVDSFDLISSL